MPSNGKRALDHFQSVAKTHSPRFTGLLWMSSIDADKTSVLKMFRSYPGPSCQKRNQYFPARSRTVNCSTSDVPASTSSSLISFEVDCFVRANSRLPFDVGRCRAVR